MTPAERASRYRSRDHGQVVESRWGPTSCWWAKYLRDARIREQGRRRAAKSYLARKRATLDFRPDCGQFA